MQSSKAKISDDSESAQQILGLPSGGGRSSGRRLRDLQKHLLHPKGSFMVRKTFRTPQQRIREVRNRY